MNSFQDMEQGRLAGLQAETAEQKGRLAGQEQMLEQHEREVAALKSAQDALVRERDAAEKRAQALETQLRRAQTQAQGLAKDRETATQLLDNTGDRWSSHNDAINSALNDIAMYKQRRGEELRLSPSLIEAMEEAVKAKEGEDMPTTR